MVDQHTPGGDEDRAGLSASSDDPMSRVHAHARTHEAALRWLAGYDPQDGKGGPIGETEGHEEFTRDVVLAAFEAGRASAIAERAVADVSQAVALAAIGLLTEAGRLFRQYEAHHRAKTAEWSKRHGENSAGSCAGREKIERNAGMADRIESFLSDPTTPRDTLTGLALSLVQDLDDLIQHSEGVAGLHMNGDVADWGSLTEGGTFGAWLSSYDRLRHALDELFPGPTDDAPCSCASGAQGAPVDASCPVHGLPDDEEEADPAATVRTIEAAVAGGPIPGIDEDRLSLARVAHERDEARWENRPGAGAQEFAGSATLSATNATTSASNASTGRS